MQHRGISPYVRYGFIARCVLQVGADDRIASDNVLPISVNPLELYLRHTGGIKLELTCVSAEGASHRS